MVHQSLRNSEFMHLLKILIAFSAFLKIYDIDENSFVIGNFL